MSAPVVTTTSGRVRGEEADKVTRFRAIPYAAAPVGALRFAAPAPAPAWEGIRDATRPGPTAPQGSRRLVPGLDIAPIMGTGWVPGPEYLTVDVWSPDTGTTGLPVMVFIHGGGFLAGTGSAPTYDGTRFARSGVVLVTINYRVGIEGFLPVPGGETNIGLRDQIAALRWVRANAAAFGGDPDKVTVFGESAGAMSISCLLGSPLAAGLFHRAIIESGHTEMVRPEAQAALLTKHLAKALGIPADVDGFRSTTAEELIAAQQALQLPGNCPDLRDPSGHEPAYGITPFLPVACDEVLPRHPGTAIARGAGAGIDVIVGTCREEMNLYVASGAVDSLDDQSAVTQLSAYHPDAAAVLDNHGLGTDGRHPGAVLVEALTDLAFRIPARRLATGHAGRTHLYEFAWRSPACGGRLGACHGLELPFVFDTLPTATGPQGLAGEHPPQSIADHLHNAWVDFATTGDPGWPPYVEDRLLLHVDTTPSIRPDDTPLP
ncbi:carboxylesterase [Streptomyces griseocarneus]|nr:carboxylesterase [Streptomyces griseocarneus]